MSLAPGSKRCSNCCFWQYYTGPVENKIMRRLQGQEQAPARKAHACQLWLRDSGEVDDAGNPVMVPVFPIQAVRDTDVPGPEFGQRTGKWHSCGHIRGKLAPYTTPPPKVEIAADHIFTEGLQNIVIPERVEDIRPLGESVEMPLIPVSF